MGYSDSDEDESFYYRYSSTATSSPPQASSSTPNPNPKSNGSGGLAPSKSTVYVSNLDFSLTNSDLHTLFSTFGKIARVTVLKHRVSRKSRGVAFVQFVNRTDAVSAAKQMDKKVLNGRTLSASIAVDNGRAPEFIRKRVYKDKSRCYECGEGGHLSYECPRNQLGQRERPVPKKARRGGGGRVHSRRGVEEEEGEGEDWEGGEAAQEEAAQEDNWAAVVDGRADERLLRGGEEEAAAENKKKKVVKKKSYFSDESDEEE